MKRLYLRLTEKEYSTLKRTRDVTLGTSSLRAAIMALCDSDLVRKLSYIIRTEVELRKVSVNLGQIFRRLEETGFDTDSILFIRDYLYELIDLFTAESYALRMDDAGLSSARKEVAVWLSDEEKEEVSSIKKILRFRTFRAMVLGLCRIADERIFPVDISSEYSRLRDFGQKMNSAARALNSGESMDLDELIRFLGDFYHLLLKLSEKVSGGDDDVC